MIPLALAARLPWRTIGLALAAAALVAGAVWAWNDRYRDGVKAGRAALAAEVAEAQRKALAAELARRSQIEQRHAAERDRLTATIAAIQSGVNDYAQSPDAARACPSPRGRRLWQDAIDAANGIAAPAPTDGLPGPAERPGD